MSIFQVADDSILYCMVSGLTWFQLSYYLVSMSCSLDLPSHVFCVSVYFFHFRVHSQLFFVCRKRLIIQSRCMVSSLFLGYINYIIFHCCAGVALCPKLLMFHFYIKFNILLFGNFLLWFLQVFPSVGSFWCFFYTLSLAHLSCYIFFRCFCRYL